MTRGTITLALNGHIFDLKTGFANFLTFLTDAGGHFPENITSLPLHGVLTKLEKIFEHDSLQNKFKISSGTLFIIMHAIQLHTQITNANVLDESCNVSIDSTKPLVVKTDLKTGEMVERPVLIARDKMPVLPPGTGYGGTKKYKKYKRKTRLYRVK